MKLLIFLILSIPLFCNSQTIYGFAGQNVGKNLTTETIGYINDMIPEGGSYIDDFCQYKYVGKCPDAEIDNYIELKNTLEANGKNYYMIYSFDARALQSISDNFYAFDKFSESNINIIASRIGNEEFSKAGHNNNWTLYMTHCTPIINGLNERGFTGKIIFPIRRPAEHGSWNISAIEFINSNSQYEPDCHPYWNESTAPVLSQIEGDKETVRELPKEVVTGSYLPSKDLFYSDLYTQVTTGNFYQDVMDYHRANFPNKKLWITEGIIIGVGQISGTIGYEACFDWFLNQTLKDQDIIAAVCRFNGAGITGSITPLSKYDISTGTGFIKRLGYYTLRNFLHNKDLQGTNVFSYHNLTREVKDLSEVISIPQGMRLQGAYFECLTGSNFYSSSGSCAWWGVGTVKSYDISDVTVFDFIPELSYGYIHYTLEPLCYDTLITVIDTTYITVREEAYCPPRCTGFIYSLFNGKKCKLCGTFIEVQEMILTERIVTETKCN